MSLEGKKILLGITGGIAAYKIPLLVRLLTKAGAEVQTILTPSATDFVTPLTLSTLSGKPALTQLVDTQTQVWNNHVALAAWADLMVFAPVTARTLAKMATGMADNLLMTVYLSAKCPVMIAPAMDLDMYRHPTTKENLDKLASFGHIIIPATQGELASGLTGYGRMEEPENIYQKVVDFFEKKKSLAGKKVVITAGPTYESIDPVRFIGNHSSGKMGVALANEAAERGAQVYLVLGPSQLQVSHPNIKVIWVQNAAQMYEATHTYFPESDIAILAAAVADYTPEKTATHKIKKAGDALSIKLKATKDILASLGKIKTKAQILVGFAMETQNEIENAKKKLVKKNLDFIVLNKLNDKNAGFKHDTNKVTILDKSGKIETFPLVQKSEVAQNIFDKIEELL